jgi:hypothetical protein
MQAYTSSSQGLRYGDGVKAAYRELSKNIKDRNAVLASQTGD